MTIRATTLTFICQRDKDGKKGDKVAARFEELWKPRDDKADLTTSNEAFIASV